MTSAFIHPSSHSSRRTFSVTSALSSQSNSSSRSSSSKSTNNNNNHNHIKNTNKATSRITSSHYIPSERIEKIKQSVNILDVMETHGLQSFVRSVDNTRATALCPFHNDHNPSLSICANRGIYKCFSCGAGGDVFNFVREFDMLVQTAQQQSQLLQADADADADADAATDDAATDAAAPSKFQSTSKLKEPIIISKMTFVEAVEKVEREFMNDNKGGNMNGTYYNSTFLQSYHTLSSSTHPLQQSRTKSQSLHDRLTQISMERIRYANSAAAEYYARMLVSSSKGGIARSHLRSRGTPPTLVRTFGLGYAPDAYYSQSSSLLSPPSSYWGEGSCVEHLRSLGFRPEEIVQAGLATITSIAQKKLNNNHNKIQQKMMMMKEEEDRKQKELENKVNIAQTKTTINDHHGITNHNNNTKMDTLINSPSLESSSSFVSLDYSDIMDRFRNRLMVPIFDSHGSYVIGFGGRHLDNNDITSTTKAKSFKPAKYINSPETIAFSKKNVLFGYHTVMKHFKEQLKRREEQPFNDNMSVNNYHKASSSTSITMSSSIIIVEGYFDAMALHDAGISNAVSCMGSAISREQLDLALGRKHPHQSKRRNSYDEKDENEIEGEDSDTDTFNKDNEINMEDHSDTTANANTTTTDQPPSFIPPPPLPPINSIILCMDRDDAGYQAVERLCSGSILYDLTFATPSPKTGQPYAQQQQQYANDTVDKDKRESRFQNEEENMGYGFISNAEILVATLPEDVKDPADFVAARSGGDACGDFQREVLDTALPWNEWYIRRIVSRYHNDGYMTYGKGDNKEEEKGVEEKDKNMLPKENISLKEKDVDEDHFERKKKNESAMGGIALEQRDHRVSNKDDDNNLRQICQDISEFLSNFPNMEDRKKMAYDAAAMLAKLMTNQDYNPKLNKINGQRHSEDGDKTKGDITALTLRLESKLIDDSSKKIREMETAVSMQSLSSSYPPYLSTSYYDDYDDDSSYSRGTESNFNISTTDIDESGKRWLEQNGYSPTQKNKQKRRKFQQTNSAEETWMASFQKKKGRNMRPRRLSEPSPLTDHFAGFEFLNPTDASWLGVPIEAWKSSNNLILGNDALIQYDNEGSGGRYQSRRRIKPVYFNSNAFLGNKYITQEALNAGYSRHQLSSSNKKDYRSDESMIGFGMENILRPDATDLLHSAEDRLLETLIRYAPAREAMRSAGAGSGSGSGIESMEWTSPEKEWLFHALLDGSGAMSIELQDGGTKLQLLDYCRKRKDAPIGAFGNKDNEQNIKDNDEDKNCEDTSCGKENPSDSRGLIMGAVNANETIFQNIQHDFIVNDIHQHSSHEIGTLDKYFIDNEHDKLFLEDAALSHHVKAELTVQESVATILRATAIKRMIRLKNEWKDACRLLDKHLLATRDGDNSTEFLRNGQDQSDDQSSGFSNNKAYASLDYKQIRALCNDLCIKVSDASKTVHQLTENSKRVASRLLDCCGADGGVEGRLSISQQEELAKMLDDHIATLPKDKHRPVKRGDQEDYIFGLDEFDEEIDSRFGGKSNLLDEEVDMKTNAR